MRAGRRLLLELSAHEINTLGNPWASRSEILEISKLVTIGRHEIGQSIGKLAKFLSGSRHVIIIQLPGAVRVPRGFSSTISSTFVNDCQ
jgi:hypothetical protein